MQHDKMYITYKIKDLNDNMFQWIEKVEFKHEMSDIPCIKALQFM